MLVQGLTFCKCGNGHGHVGSGVLKIILLAQIIFIILRPNFLTSTVNLVREITACDNNRSYGWIEKLMAGDVVQGLQAEGDHDTSLSKI